jgi:hypothetical protein
MPFIISSRHYVCQSCKLQQQNKNVKRKNNAKKEQSTDGMKHQKQSTRTPAIAPRIGCTRDQISLQKTRPATFPPSQKTVNPLQLACPRLPTHDRKSHDPETQHHGYCLRTTNHAPKLDHPSQGKRKKMKVIMSGTLKYQM